MKDAYFDYAQMLMATRRKKQMHGKNGYFVLVICCNSNATECHENHDIVPSMALIHELVRPVEALSGNSAVHNSLI